MRRRENNGKIPIKIEQLVVGYEFPPSVFELEPVVVSKYLEAVGVKNSKAPEVVPPMAIAAYTMAVVVESIALPAGTIHASQELEFLKAVPVGATISCRGRVARNINRGKLNLLAIELEALDQNQEKVLGSQATLVIST